MTPGQCRAARGFLGWSRVRLACIAAVTETTVIGFEEERREIGAEKVEAIRAALEAAGVEFTDGDAPGVRLRKVHADPKA